MVVALAALVAHHVTDGFDRAVDAPVIGWVGGQHALLDWTAFPGTSIPAVAVSTILAAACLRARRLNGAVLAVTAVPVSTGIDEWLLKPVVHRTYLGSLAFPSGHSTTVMALTTVVALLYFVPPQPIRTRLPRALVLTVGIAATCVVMLSVIALRWHYFTDTVAGAAVGAGVVLALSFVLDLPMARRLLVSRSWHAAGITVGGRPLM